MPLVALPHLNLHYTEDGDPAGFPVVFANSLGTDLRLWEAVLPYLPEGFRYIRYDKRGHGLSELPKGPAPMTTYAEDIAALLDHLQTGPVVFVGLSIGGMIGITLAAQRPDLMRALVLSNSAVQMGTPEAWAARIAAIEAGGIDAVAEPILDRWFGTAFRHGPELPLWRNMLMRTDVHGYLTACAAIRDCDLTQEAKGLALPCLALSGSQDQACAPEITRASAALVPGASFAVIDGAGHLPCAEHPKAFAAHLISFLKETAHAEPL